METDEKLLLEKAHRALERYGHKLVIANELKTRKHRVILVSADDHEEVTVKDDSIDIESLIVKKVISRHDEYIASKNMKN